MNTYIINKNRQDSKSGLNYEVHKLNDCNHLPNLENRIELGIFNDCEKAVAYAKDLYPKQAKDIDGCYYCCYSCHNE